VVLLGADAHPDAPNADELRRREAADVVAAVRAAVTVPVAAYQVSGEYAMLAAAAERGWLDGPRAIEESVTAIVRAGAGIVITYAAAELAAALRGVR
jgi:porphobilinogen synthase